MVAKEVTFQPEGKRLRIKSGSTILEVARQISVDLSSICNGLGTCGKCKVLIEGNKIINPVTEVEKELLSQNEISAGYRLACQTLIQDQLIVRIPDESRTGKQRLQIEGIETPVKPEPEIRKYYVEMSSPTLEDPKSDFDRLLNAISTKYGIKNLKIQYNVLQNLPIQLRTSGWAVTVIVWKNDIIGLETGDTTKRIFGYAVDIGTTKLAGYILDLTTGKVLAAGSLMNPQIPYGEDVIARVTYAMQGLENRKELQRVVVDGINNILIDLCEKTGVDRKEIYEMTAVGNTAMHHLFLKIDPKNMALAPYTPAIREGIDIDANEVGIGINHNGHIHIFPVIAGFVGADTVAVTLATRMNETDELCLSLDIGTNTEVVLGNNDRMLTCSCASGPAFEGAHIKHGMRAATGAIEKVMIDPQKCDVRYWTIDNAKPCGICGSALVDIVAEMLKAGIIDYTGTINKSIDLPRLRANGREFEFVVAWKQETSANRDIVITQNDIREIQLAKAAMHTGVAILMKKMRVSEKDIRLLFIAGAFGSYINPESARTIGMYPEISLKKVKVVGNAAGTGARMALVSRTEREKAEKISKKVRYIELAVEPNFNVEFMNSYFIPHADLKSFPETNRLLEKLRNGSK